MDTNLIKAKENPVALRRALHQPAPMPKMFIPMSPLKVHSTTATVVATEERPLKIETNLERGLTTTTLAPQATQT